MVGLLGSGRADADGSGSLRWHRAGCALSDIDVELRKPPGPADKRVRAMLLEPAVLTKRVL